MSKKSFSKHKIYSRIEGRLIYSVLVIDDEREMRKMLSDLLSMEGFSVETVANGKEAVKACEKLAFDVALIDVELPDIKGTDLITELKFLRPKMVNIIITGYPSIENAIKAVNQKADWYVLKPFDIPALVETMKKLIAEKTHAYFQMFTEVERAKEKTPLFKYQRPDNW
jgi:DNA-binding NtrC family response regulator